VRLRSARHHRRDLPTLCGIHPARVDVAQTRSMTRLVMVAMLLTQLGACGSGARQPRKGAERQLEVRYTAVYRSSADGWQLVSWQSTRIQR
jgi:hypothetical protein